MEKTGENKQILKNDLNNLINEMLKHGLSKSDLQKYSSATCTLLINRPKCRNFYGAIFISSFVCLIAGTYLFNSLVSLRCLIPNNYLVWEATRPISDCSFCLDVDRPIILYNLSKINFKDFAYSSKPIIVKGAAKHWKAMNTFSYDLFKDLYENTRGAYQSVEEGCQFLHFRSDLLSLKEVFSMSDDRARNLNDEKPWYIGWGNCHPHILETIRQHYSYPEFLPDDAEMPNSENIFFGYEQGAVFHLDYIARLMWQGQVKGNKTWQLAPVPECENLCKPFSFYVEPGDLVFLDTRVWYHATTIPKGQFALTVQSEYG